MGFFMSFVLLIISLYTFSLVSTRTSEEATRAGLNDLANRVANAVLDAVEVGQRRAGSTSTATSDNILYVTSLMAPTRLQGHEFRTTLTSGEVTVVSSDGTITVKAPTFNVLVTGCSTAVSVCYLGGSVLSGTGSVHVKYEYKAGASSTTCGGPPISCVTIA